MALPLTLLVSHRPETHAAAPRSRYPGVKLLPSSVNWVRSGCASKSRRIRRDPCHWQSDVTASGPPGGVKESVQFNSASDGAGAVVAGRADALRPPGWPAAGTHNPSENTRPNGLAAEKRKQRQRWRYATGEVDRGQWYVTGTMRIVWNGIGRM